MKVLIAPMAAMAETSGPFSRSASLCKELIRSGHEAAFCAAIDINYREIDGIENYEVPVPSPMGVPMAIGKRVFPVVQALGLQQKRQVKSFEQVLHFVGATAPHYFARDVELIRRAIRAYQPDVVYAEFRIAAIAAAKLERCKVATGYSYPARKAYASNPECSKGMRKLLHRYGLPDAASALDLFEWADLKIVPSSYELEPIDDSKVVFTGPFAMKREDETTPAAKKRNLIIAYMGNGTISPKETLHKLSEAFENTHFELYIASAQLDPLERNNVHVGKRFPFSELMPRAAVFLNHGGQNSIMTGLVHGVPQIIRPGNVFERQYNAASIEKLGTGMVFQTEQFRSYELRGAIERLSSDPEYSQRAAVAGKQLMNLGGEHTAVLALEALVNVPIK